MIQNITFRILSDSMRSPHIADGAYVADSPSDAVRPLRVAAEGNRVHLDIGHTPAVW